MKGVLVNCSAVALAIGLVLGSGQPEDCRAVIDRYLDAVGGRERLVSVENLSFTLTGYDVSGEFMSRDRFYCAPNTVGTTMPDGAVLETDGHTVWRIEGGVRSEIDNPFFLRSANFASDFLFYEEKGISYSYVGKTTLRGVEFHVLEKRYADGYREKLFFSEATGLLTMVKQQRPDGVATRFLWNYQDVEGIKLPMIWIAASDDTDGIHGGLITNVAIDEPGRCGGKNAENEPPDPNRGIGEETPNEPAAVPHHGPCDRKVGRPGQGDRGAGR
jgi:hypothetical protein